MLKLNDIHKAFNIGTINEKQVFQGLNFHLEPGDFCTVIGGNGAGKSTMLNAIAGVWPVESGSIVIDGQDVSGLCEHKRAKLLSRVFQDPRLGTATDMTIAENMALAARRGNKHTLMPGIRSKELKEYRDKIAMLDLGLENRMTTKVGLLSGGQRQAITLLMATLRQPKLLLLDEHTAALDPKTAAKVLSLTRQLVEEQHLTTIMITHNMKDAIEHGNRLIMMNKGQIVADVRGEEKASLTVQDLLQLFANVGGEMNDRILLS